MRILIAEDEPKPLELLRDHFVIAGHEVLGTPSGQGVLEHIQVTPPDVLLLDLLLKGGMHGLDVLMEVRQRSPATAVIVITGLEEDSTHEEAMRRGALAVLRKPINIEELDRLVSSVSRRNNP